MVASRFGLSDEVQSREMDNLTSEKQNNYGGPGGPRVSFYEAALMMLCTRNFRPKTRFWAAAKRIMLHRQKALHGHHGRFPRRSVRALLFPSFSLYSYTNHLI